MRVFWRAVDVVIVLLSRIGRKLVEVLFGNVFEGFLKNFPDGNVRRADFRAVLTAATAFSKGAHRICHQLRLRAVCALGELSMDKFFEVSW